MSHRVLFLFSFCCLLNKGLRKQQVYYAAVTLRPNALIQYTDFPRCLCSLRHNWLRLCEYWPRQAFWHIFVCMWVRNIQREWFLISKTNDSYESVLINESNLNHCNQIQECFHKEPVRFSESKTYSTSSVVQFPTHMTLKSWLLFSESKTQFYQCNPINFQMTLLRQFLSVTQRQTSWQV